MKTKEFVEKIKELGFEPKIEYYNNDRSIYITTKNKDSVAVVQTDKIYQLNTCYGYFEQSKYDTRNELFNLLVEYSSTPTKERKNGWILFTKTTKEWLLCKQKNLLKKLKN